jgi:hypothetical protein
MWAFTRPESAIRTIDIECIYVCGYSYDPKELDETVTDLCYGTKNEDREPALTRPSHITHTYIYVDMTLLTLTYT